MPLQLKCPSCGRELRVPDNLMGQRVKCPSCSTTFTADPGAGEAPAPEPERERPAPISDRPRDEPRDRDDFRDLPRRSDPGRYDDDRDYRPRGAPHRGGMVLTFGILSIVLAFCCSPAGIGFGIAAWVMGQGDLAKIRSGDMDPGGEGSTKGGWICGIIGTCLSGILLICGVLNFVVNSAAGR